jgi:hypothetical protein
MTNDDLRRQVDGCRVIDSAEIVARALVAAGVRPTPSAINAALRAPRAPVVEEEMARGYLAACERWGAPIGRGVETLEGENGVETVRPRGRDEKASEHA